MIDNNFKLKYISAPYGVWIIDDFLDQKANEGIIKEWPSYDSGRWHGGYKKVGEEDNILETGMLAIDNNKDMPGHILSVLDYFHSDSFKDLIEDITEQTDLIIDETRRWAGLRAMLKNSKQMIHSDADIHPESNLKKKLTLLYYLNEGYNRERDEGCLEVWNDNMSEKVHEIEPLNNRFVIFEDSSTSYHGVPLVKSERKSITLALLKEEETTKRSKALFVSRPGDSPEISRLGILRSKI